MHHMSIMGNLEAEEHLAEHHENISGTESTVGVKTLTEVTTIHELHCKEGRRMPSVDLLHCDDVRMTELEDCLAFLTQMLHEVRVSRDLERELRVEVEVTCEPYLAERTLPKLTHESVGTHFLMSREHHSTILLQIAGVSSYGHCSGYSLATMESTAQGWQFASSDLHNRPQSAAHEAAQATSPSREHVGTRTTLGFCDLHGSARAGQAGQAAGYAASVAHQGSHRSASRQAACLSWPGLG